MHLKCKVDSRSGKRNGNKRKGKKREKKRKKNRKGKKIKDKEENLCQLWWTIVT
jgi:hypothetical protein